MVLLWTVIIVVGIANLKLIWFMKYFARPARKLANSTKTVPGRTTVNHECSLPVPFPIRTPFALRVKGKWGKALSQKSRFVLSDFLLDFLRNMNKRKICFPVNRKDWSVKIPVVPYRRLCPRKVFWDLFLWRVLYVNLLGCNSTSQLNNYRNL